MTAVALSFVYQALLAVSTRIGEVFPDGSLEEAFAAFTAVHAIVLPWVNNIQNINFTTLPEKLLHIIVILLVNVIVHGYWVRTGRSKISNEVIHKISNKLE